MGFGLFLNQSGYSDSAVTPTWHQFPEVLKKALSCSTDINSLALSVISQPTCAVSNNHATFKRESRLTPRGHILKLIYFLQVFI